LQCGIQKAKIEQQLTILLGHLRNLKYLALFLNPITILLREDLHSKEEIHLSSMKLDILDQHGPLEPINIFMFPNPKISMSYHLNLMLNASPLDEILQN
jgi:hypothetical protein